MTLLILDIGLSMKAAASRSPPRSVAGAAMRHAQVFASAIPISSDTTVVPLPSQILRILPMDRTLFAGESTRRNPLIYAAA